MVQIICFSWIFGVGKGVEEAHKGAQLKIPRFYRFIMKYVTPTYLLVVFAAFSYNNLPSWLGAVAAQPLKQGAMAMIVGTLVLLLICTRVGEKRWRAAGLDLDGREPAPRKEVA